MSCTRECLAGLSQEIGVATKDARNPLVVQDKPWEARCDNSYPNVVYDPKDPNGAWRAWYGCFIVAYNADKGQGENRQNGNLYMHSQDGITWEKPNLGRLDLSKLPDPKPDSFAKIGANNNIVLGKSDGVGVYKDLFDSNASRKFKMFGTGCFGKDAYSDCISGTADVVVNPTVGPCHQLQGGQGVGGSLVESGSVYSCH